MKFIILYRNLYRIHTYLVNKQNILSHFIISCDQFVTMDFQGNSTKYIIPVLNMF